MGEEAGLQVFTTHGLLGLGWLCFFMIAYRYVTLTEKFVTLLERNTQVMTSLDTLIRERLK